MLLIVSKVILLVEKKYITKNNTLKYYVAMCGTWYTLFLLSRTLMKGIHHRMSSIRCFTANHLRIWHAYFIQKDIGFRFTNISVLFFLFFLYI